jgi:hypothetical protein
MDMKRILACTILILLLSAPAMAESGETPANWTEATPESMAEAGFKHLVQGDYVKMVEEWFNGFDPTQMGGEKAELAKRQYLAQMPLVGKCSRYELAVRKMYGKSLIKLKYIAFTEKAPIFFTFIYYKPDQEWLAANISFSDEVSTLDE